MLKQAKQNKNRLKILQPKTFNHKKIVFKQNDFYNKLNIKPVNVILLSNSIHFANINSIHFVLNNLLNYLSLNGLIIIKEPWINAIFADPKLNDDSILRNNKLNYIKKIKDEIFTFISNSSFIKLLDFNYFNDNQYYLLIIKKI